MLTSISMGAGCTTWKCRGWSCKTSSLQAIRMRCVHSSGSLYNLTSLATKHCGKRTWSRYHVVTSTDGSCRSADSNDNGCQKLWSTEWKCRNSKELDGFPWRIGGTIVTVMGLACISVWSGPSPGCTRFPCWTVDARLWMEWKILRKPSCTRLIDSSPSVSREDNAILKLYPWRAGKVMPSSNRTSPWVTSHRVCVVKGLHCGGDISLCKQVLIKSVQKKVGCHGSSMSSVTVTRAVRVSGNGRWMTTTCAIVSGCPPEARPFEKNLLLVLHEMPLWSEVQPIQAESLAQELHGQWPDCA